MTTLNMTTMSQKAARENLGSPENFRGGVYVTKNGAAELFVQTATEREAETTERYIERQANALLKLTMLAKKEITSGQGSTPEDVLKRLRDART